MKMNMGVYTNVTANHKIMNHMLNKTEILLLTHDLTSGEREHIKSKMYQKSESDCS